MGFDTSARGESDGWNLVDQGFELLPAFLDDPPMAAVRSEVAASAGLVPPYGIRHAERKFASIRAILDSPLFRAFLRDRFAQPARLLRAIYFDKTPGNNWYVTWHQDKTIAVERKFDRPGWGPWSIKDSMPHVQPPAEFLESILTLRVHLDDADTTNGCLWVVPGSHRRGVLSPSGIDNAVRDSHPTPCVVRAGDALLMRPLLIHASRRAETPRPRRVLHFEFGEAAMLDGLG